MLREWMPPEPAWGEAHKRLIIDRLTCSGRLEFIRGMAGEVFSAVPAKVNFHIDFHRLNRGHWRGFSV